MGEIDFDTQISVRQAYLIMFEFIDRYYNSFGERKPDDIAALLGHVSLWDTKQGKQPMDSTIFPQWIDCTKRVLQDEGTSNGYKGADVQLKK